MVPKQRTANLTSNEQNWDTKIFGKVERVHLRLGDRALGNTEDETSSHNFLGWRYLLSTVGETVGVIWVEINNHKGNAKHGMEDRIECIAISKGELHLAATRRTAVGVSEGQFNEWELERRRKAGVYRFYNVMWVDRTDEVATRRAVGRVDQKLGNNLEWQKIDILLN